MGFGSRFYSSHKPSASLLTLTVNNFYNQFGKPVKIESPTAFFEGISLFLSERITSKVQKVKAEEQAEENALDNGADGTSGDRAPMDVHHPVDHERPLVAVRSLGLRGNCVGRLVLGLLFQARCLHLSGMSRGVSASV
jgi:hypothetical protein